MIPFVSTESTPGFCEDTSDHVPFRFFKNEANNIFYRCGGQTFDELMDLPIDKEDTDELVRNVAFHFEGRANITRLTGGSTKRTYICDCANCPWSVTFRRHFKQKNIGPFFLQEIPEPHSENCMMTTVCTERHILRNSPKLWELLNNQPDCKFSAAKIQLLPEIDIRTMREQTYSGVRTKILEKIRTHNAHRYAQLPFYLEEFVKLNFGSTAALQLDDQGRFCRMFVCALHAVQAFVNGTTAEIYIIDGGHSKTKQYHGHHLVLVTKDGNGKNVPLAYGWVPCEGVVANLCWFMQMVVRAGFPLSKIPIFTDRGHLLNAAAVLAVVGIHLNLKYCLIHLISNISHNFKLSGLTFSAQRTVIRARVFAIQASQSPHRFVENMQDLVSSLPDDNLGLRVSIYLLSVDPLHWIVFANNKRFDRDDYVREWNELTAKLILKLSDVEVAIGWMNPTEAWERAVNHCASSVPCGFPSPLHGITNTNRAEGMNRASLFSWRMFAPCQGLEIYVLHIQRRYQTFVATACLFRDDTVKEMYTAVALRSVLDARKKCVNWEVKEGMKFDDGVVMEITLVWAPKRSAPTQSTERPKAAGKVHLIVDTHDEHEVTFYKEASIVPQVERNVRVDPESGITCDCCKNQQQQIICSCGYMGLMEYSNANNVHFFDLIVKNCAEHHKRSNYIETWLGLPEMKVPSVQKLQERPIEKANAVLPPPCYKMEKDVDSSKVIKRFKSRGEANGGRTKESPRKAPKSRHVEGRYTNGSRLLRGQEITLLYLKRATEVMNSDYLTASTRTAKMPALDAKHLKDTLERMEVEKTVNTLLIGKVGKKRSCEFCFSTKHYKTTCPSYLGGTNGYCSPADIVPGEYAFYSAPNAPVEFRHKPEEIQCKTKQQSRNRWVFEDDARTNKHNIHEGDATNEIPTYGTPNPVDDDCGHVQDIGYSKPVVVSRFDLSNVNAEEDDAETQEILFDVAQKEASHPSIDIEALEKVIESDSKKKPRVAIPPRFREATTWLERQYRSTSDIFKDARAKMTQAMLLLDELWKPTGTFVDLALSQKFLTVLLSVNMDQSMSAIPLQNANGQYLNVTSRSVRTLHGSQWLNDAIINSMGGLLAKRYSLIASFHTQQTTTAFATRNDPFYFDQMVENESILGKRLFGMHEYLFFPFNISNTHWILMVADMKQKRVIYYDSMAYPSAKERLIEVTDSRRGNGVKLNQVLLFLEARSVFEFDNARAHVRGELRSIFDRKEWKMFVWHPSRQLQRDTFNCGVYTIMFMVEIAKNNNTEDMPFGFEHPRHSRLVLAAIFLLYQSKV
jgi:hypothetical protein